MAVIDLKPLVLECINGFLLCFNCYPDSRHLDPARYTTFTFLDLAGHCSTEPTSLGLAVCGKDTGFIVFLCSWHTVPFPIRVNHSGCCYGFREETLALSKLRIYGELCIEIKDFNPLNLELKNIPDFEAVFTARPTWCECPDILTLAQYLTLPKPVPEPEPVAIDALI